MTKPERGLGFGIGICMDIKLSIISPFYNVEAYLDRFLSMLRLQTLGELEIILVDDCGTDGSRAIADAHAKEDPRIRIVSNERNMGLGASRNVGITYATGQYFAFPDSDDWVDADFYAGLFETAVGSGYPDIVKGRFESDGLWGELEARVNTNESIRTRLAEGVPLYSCFTWQHWTAIYHQRLFTELGVRHGAARSTEDLPFLLQACHKAESFVVSDAPGAYHYTYRQDSITQNYTPDRYASDMESLAQATDYLIEEVPIDRWAYRYVAQIAKRLLWVIGQIQDEGFSSERVCPQKLREQLLRLPDADMLASLDEDVARVLAGEPCF